VAGSLALSDHWRVTLAESSMSYDPRDHLVTLNDISVGMGLFMTLLA